MIFQSGKSNVVADAISRRPYPESNQDVEREFEDMLMTIGQATEEPDTTRCPKKKSILIELEYESELPEDATLAAIENGNVVIEIGVDIQDVASAQQNCPDFQDMFRYLQEGTLLINQDQARKIAITSDQHDILDSILYYFHHPRRSGMEQNNPVIKQLCLPHAMRQEIVDGDHTKNCHIGFDRLFATLKQKHYWSKMYSQLRGLVMGCQECQQSKKHSKEKRVLLCPLPIVPSFERLHIEILGPLTESEDGYQYVLLVIESFSRFPDAIPS